MAPILLLLYISVNPYPLIALQFLLFVCVYYSHVLNPESENLYSKAMA